MDTATATQRQVNAAYTTAKAAFLSALVAFLGVISVAIYTTHSSALVASVGNVSFRSLAETAPNVSTPEQSASAVYLSTSPQSAAGWTQQGSLYRGSGFWTPNRALSSPRSSLGAAADGSLVYLAGGLTADGAPIDTLSLYDAVLDQYNETLPNMPSARSGVVLALLKGSIFVLGGNSAADNSTLTPEACSFIYDTQTLKWSSGSKLACMVDARTDFCGAVVNGVIYVAGGTGAKGQALDSIEAYNADTGSWKVVGKLPSPRSNPMCAAVNNTLYIAGGYDSSAKDPSQAWLGDLLAFDPVSATVSTKTSMNHPRAAGGLVTLPGNRLMMMGGQAFVNNKTTVAIPYVEEYIGDDDAWIERAPLPIPRYHIGAAYADGAVFTFGGEPVCPPNIDCTTRALDAVSSFYDLQHPNVYVHTRDPQTLTASPAPSDVLLYGSKSAINGFSYQGNLYAGTGYWVPQPSLPTTLTDHSAVTVGSNIYVIGGADQAQGVVVDTVWIYDPVLQQWTEGPAMPEPRNRFAVATLNNKIYVAAGFNSLADDAQCLDTMFVLDLKTGEWSESSAKLNIARSDACMSAVAGKLYLAGGYDTNYTNILSSMEMYDPDSNEWTVGVGMPTPRGDNMCANLGESDFVVAGGYYDPTYANPLAFRQEVEAYDVTSGQWRQLAPLLDARGDNVIVTLPDGRLLIMGGETGVQRTADDISRTAVATRGVALYLPDQDVWVRKAPMSFARFRFAAAYADGVVYAVAGEGTPVCTVAADVPGGICIDRGINSVEAFYDIDYPDVFVYTKDVPQQLAG